MNESSKRTHVTNARRLLRTQHSGVLATQSLSVKGFPFGSVTPFMMTDQGNLVIYASDIAQHSRNMKSNEHVSLCVHDGSESDSQASARVTVLARATWDDVSEVMQQRYFALFPQARAYVKAHDFRFYTLTTDKVRYIGGFGEIYWFSQHEWCEAVADMQVSETGIISHMMEDHVDAIQLMLRQQFKVNAELEAIKMLTTFAEGFHVKAEHSTYFIVFQQALKDRSAVRDEMVKLTHAARSVV